MATDSSRGELLSATGPFTTVATWRSDSQTFELEGKLLQGTIEADGSLRLESVTLADDLSLRAEDARAQQAHELQKRREDVRLVQQDLLALERKLRQPPADDDDEEPRSACWSKEVVRLNQLLGQHERAIESLEQQRQLKVTYTETSEASTVRLPPGVIVSVPATAATRLLWCPRLEPVLVRNSSQRTTEVEASPAPVAPHCSTYVLPQPGRGATVRRAAVLCVGSSGLLYVLEEDGSNLWSFELKMAGIASYGVPRVLSKKRRLRPVALVYCHGRFYATDSEARGLVVINGGLRPEAITTVSACSQWALHGAAAAGDTLFVTDRARHVVRALSVPAAPGSERLLYEWGSRGSAPGQFNSPAGLACADGKVWVADSLNHRVQAFDAQDGKLVAHWGQQGTQAGALHHPHALALCQGLVFVADYPGAWRVQAFTPAGQWAYVCSMSGLERAPTLVAFGDQVCVSGFEHGNVLAFRVTASSSCS